MFGLFIPKLVSICFIKKQYFYLVSLTFLKNQHALKTIIIFDLSSCLKNQHVQKKINFFFFFFFIVH